MLISLIKSVYMMFLRYICHGRNANLVEFETSRKSKSSCNILTYISSFNTWVSGDSPLTQLVKEQDLYRVYI